jgi:hypothetical protein
MTLPAGATLTSPTCTGAWLNYPFKASGDSTTKVYNHFMEVKALNYTPLSDNDTMTAADEKPTNSPFPDDANAFWVEDSIPEPGDGGMIVFIRTFANIPLGRTEGAGVYAFAFPGNGSTTKVSTYNQASMTIGTVASRPEVSFTATATNALLLGIGDKFTLRTGASTRGLFQATAYGTAGLLTFGPRWVVYSKEVNGANFDIKAYAEGHEAFDISTWVYTGLTTLVVERITLEGRAAATPINASSILEYRYVKTDNINDEKLTTAFQVILAPNGTVTPTVVESITATTYPSLDIYNGLVYRGAFIAAEDEIARRWKGNIWEIVARRVTAR